jgi:hypothetical protein
MAKRSQRATPTPPLTLQALLTGERHVVASSAAWNRINSWYRAGLVSMRITNARDAAWISLTPAGREHAKSQQAAAA